ncbi:MAG: insulinase family protein [Clostridia bacterium]|nr:insulinase family protein [Clostridia bacterium]
MAMPLDDNVSARAILPYLLCRSNSEQSDELDFSRMLAKLYGAKITPYVRKVGETQILNLTMNTVDDRFALDGEKLCSECTELLCKCIFSPALVNGCFSDEAVTREKRLLCERINSLKDEKRLYAKQRLEEEMCSCEAFSISPYGTVEQVNALTGEQIYTTWIDTIERSVIQINVIGSADKKETEQVIKKYISDERKNVVSLHTEFVTSAYEEKRVEETEHLKQSKIVLGLRANMTYDRDNLGALMVMNSIFGGDVHSKLFTNVREKQSLCYYCGSSLYRYKGIIYVQCGVETENIDKAVSSILFELNEIRKGNFAQDDIDMSVLKLKDTLHCVYDSPESIDIWYSNQIASGAVIHPDEMAELVKNISKEEIIIAANDVTLDTVFVLKADGEGQEEEE